MPRCACVPPTPVGTPHCHACLPVPFPARAPILRTKVLCWASHALASTPDVVQAHPRPTLPQAPPKPEAKDKPDTKEKDSKKKKDKKDKKPKEDPPKTKKRGRGKSPPR